MKSLLLMASLCIATAAFGQDPQTPSPRYDAALALRLGADERGMKSYVLVMLKTGPKADIPEAASAEIFAGHMANIRRLADLGTLVVAGPMVSNDHHYEGIFIFNVKTIEQAQELLATDPAVASGALAYEAFGWYSSAALQEIMAIHSRIDKTAR